ncbi:hypothetical protein OCU04_005488 [Sclerotinia nivalis]|uniref:Protein kinase domain-containing protein n=1 Tax=Sclerotinia nivalis TaxID=352851 RepID=A0A9X0AP92_9HELO|nr:hypothetical protein OCU04_005488 [Sclerotinia nivalis]
MDHSFSMSSNTEPDNTHGIIGFEELPLSEKDLNLSGDLGFLDFADSSNLLARSSSSSWAMDWMTGREEYRVPFVSSTYSTHPSALRDLDTDMEIPDLSPSFPLLPPPTLVANDGEYYPTAWKKTMPNYGNEASIANPCNTVYPVMVSRESADSYNWSVCQRDDAVYSNTMASWQSQILNSTDFSPYRRRALDESSQDGITSTPLQSQSCNHEASSFITYKLKTPPHPRTSNSSQEFEATNWPPQLHNSKVSNSTSHAISYWTPPNHPILHFFYSHSLLYKSGVTLRELHMHLAAGSSGITIHGTVSIPPNATNDVNGKLGLILSQETPLNPRLYLPTRRKKISESMRQIVLELHEKGIVHGDIHLSNFLLCASENSNDQVIVKLTNFHDSLYISDSSSQTLKGYEQEEQWTPILNGRIVSPNRVNQWFKGRDRKATEEDDLYALGICMWELWSGKKYDEACGIWEGVRRGDLKGRGVDMKGVGDKGVRVWVRAWLRGGGAIV